MQSFEPCGVFARDLRECLTLQLKELDRCDPAMATLIENLHLLAAHDLVALKRVCRVSDEDLCDMIQEVKRLNPKPGLKYGASPMQPIVPDVLVRALPDGSWHVELNSDTLPRVLVNQAYYARVAKSAKSRQDKSYLIDCLQTANWLVKSLDQRARTILKVAQEIVRQQDAFLTYGVRHLRPLNLKTVADAISMHESTVSRVTANKYMATNRGLFELKYFFTSSIASSGDGDAHSSEAVRHRIKEMIEAEARSDVLSDDKIVERLKARRRGYRAAHGRKIPRSAAHSVFGAAAAAEAHRAGRKPLSGVQDIVVEKELRTRREHWRLTPWGEGSSFPARGWVANHFRIMAMSLAECLPRMSGVVMRPGE